MGTIGVNGRVWREAIQRIHGRVDATARLITDGFPFFADPDTGRWTLSDGATWTDAFWPGILWLAFHGTRAEHYRTCARSWAEKLTPRVHADTVFRCFLFYYGATMGAILGGDSLGREIGIAGARGLAEAFHPAVGVIPLGTKSEAGFRAGADTTNVDSVMAIALLSWAARETTDTRLRRIGIAHARRHIAWCVREDGSIIQSAMFHPNTGELLESFTHKGYSAKSTWARAQAWAMLGYALAMKWVPEDADFGGVAVRVADWWIDHVPTDFVAFWDFDDPQIPQTYRDTSATAAAAAALLKLSALVGDDRRRKLYRESAEATIRALVTQYLTPIHSGGPRPAGILTEGCYNVGRGLAMQHELIFGTYYLLESLYVLEGILDPSAI